MNRKVESVVDYDEYISDFERFASSDFRVLGTERLQSSLDTYEEDIGFNIFLLDNESINGEEITFMFGFVNDRLSYLGYDIGS